MRKVLKGGTLLAPLPPALVTCGTMEESNIITIGWTGILCSDPALTYISVRPQRHSHALLDAHPEFVIHLPSSSLAKQVDYCGMYTGAKVDKFEKCHFTKVKSEQVAAPTIEECPMALECRVKEVTHLGTHDMYLAEILCVTCHEDLFDTQERLHIDRANLLCYAHGEYFALGKRIGKFGFSAVKKRKKGPQK